MHLEAFFPISLSPALQEQLSSAATRRMMRAGSVLHGEQANCTGLLLVAHGRLRVYLLSNDGREITLYRLLDRDVCLFSATCVMRSIQFDVMIQAEQDTELWVIPADLYKEMMAHSAPLANYTREIMAARFSDVVWLLEQVLWMRFDRRLAGFLLEESALEGTHILKITHEAIGNHMGNPREVVTRMLRSFQREGLVRLSRGTVEIVDAEGLKRLYDA